MPELAAHLEHDTPMTKQDKKVVIYLVLAAMWLSGLTGYLIGKHEKPCIIQRESIHFRPINGSTECSFDGQEWWPARKDGMCYAADKPR